MVLELVEDRSIRRSCRYSVLRHVAVHLGALLAAVKVTGSRLGDQRLVILGAGSAGTGICDQVVVAMVHEGLSELEARSRFL